MNKNQFIKATKWTFTYISEINTKKLTRVERNALNFELLRLWNAIYVNCKDINKRYNKDF